MGTSRSSIPEPTYALLCDILTHLEAQDRALARLVAHLESSPASPPSPALEPLAAVERRHIVATFEALGKNRKRTAEVLDISPRALRYKLKAYQAA